MNGSEQAVLFLVNTVVSPVAVYVVQIVKRLTGWSGPRMAKVAALVAFGFGAVVAILTGLASIGEVLSPAVLVGGGGITATLAGAIYGTLKDRMGWRRTGAR